MASKLSDNWQDGKTLQECNLHLMEHDYSDITFWLYYKGENKRVEVVDIPALRLLCLARSPVFFAMFNGELAQPPDNREYDIHDDHADPEAFKQMIRFMYSDDVVLTADNVLAVLYLSQKYIVSTLTKPCLQFLEESLTAETAPVLLEQSMLYEEKELKEKTLKIIEEEAPAVLASDEFVDISTEALGEVLKLELKVADEVIVFEACMKWAKNQCQKMMKSTSGENLREVLGDQLYQIRFPTMSLTEFTDIVAPQDVLTGDEGYQVFRYITSESNKPQNLPFQTQQRLRTDPSPRTLMIPAPYKNKGFRLAADQAKKNVTSLSCTISKHLCLRKIYIHAYTSVYSANISHNLTVTINQNGKRVYQYTGKPSSQLPEHYAVDVDDVRVEAGAIDIELTMELKLLSPKLVGLVFPYFNLSSPSTRQLSDDYITITVPPTEGNLLLGIDYRIP